MKRRQTVPREWLIVNERPHDALWRTLRRLPRGTGVLVLAELPAGDKRRLCYLARQRGLAVATRRAAARVHNIRELRTALLRRKRMVLLSPLYPTTTHPEWKPMPVMRAAALARLGNRSLFALGGMDARRFARVRALGFQGWAGISAFRT